MKNISIFILLLVSVTVFAQLSSKMSIDNYNHYPGGDVVINGTGFNTTLAANVVWFGSTPGRVISGTSNQLVVRVPPGARADNITVVDTQKKVSAQSTFKFFPNFHGDINAQFTAANVGAPLTFGPGRYWDLCSCDFNKDGLVDVAVTQDNGSQVTIFQNTDAAIDGQLTFKQSTSINLNSPNWDIACGDLDNDGFFDLVVTQGKSASVASDLIYIIKNNAGTSFSLLTPLKAVLVGKDITVDDIKIKDLNNDGLPEIITNNSAGNTVFVFVNKGAFTFESTSRTLLGVQNINNIEIEDLDNDFFPDVVLSGIDSDNITNIFIYKNNGLGSANAFDLISKFKIENANDMITGDFDNDNDLDFAVTRLIKKDVKIFINNGLDFSAGSITIGNLGSPLGIDAGDINGDGRLDLMVSSNNNLDPGFKLLLNLDAGFSTVPIPGMYKTKKVLINDFDKDGKPDFASTGTSTSSEAHFIEFRRNDFCFMPEIQPADITTYTLCPDLTIPFTSIPSPGTTFEWYVGGNMVQSSASNVLDFNIGTYGAGELYVVAVQEGFNGKPVCSVKSNVITIVDGAGTTPVPSASYDTPLCTGSDLQLRATDPNPGGTTTYSWTGPNGFSSTQQNPLIPAFDLNKAGAYAVSVYTGGCQSLYDTVYVEPFSFGVRQIQSVLGKNFCDGKSSTLSIEPVANASYIWYKDGVDLGINAASAVVNTSGVYSVALSDNTSGCTEELASITIATGPPPSVTNFGADKTQICKGNSVRFSSDPVAGTGRSYQWNFGDGNWYFGPKDTTWVFSTAGTFDVTLKVLNADDPLCFTENVVSITVDDAVIPNITPDATIMCPGDTVNLTVLPDTYVSYNWKDGTTGQAREVYQPGIYYTVTTEDANGCVAKDSIMIDSNPVPEVLAQKDTLIFPGDTVQLSVTGTADSYLWTSNPESLNIDDPASQTPVVWPLITTQYTVTGTIIGGCSASSIVTVTVDNTACIPFEITPPKAFSPNGDLIDPTWLVDLKGSTSYIVSIYDRRGMELYSVSDYGNNPWDGTLAGNVLPRGTYFYTIYNPDADCIGKKGSVFLMK